MKTVPAITEIDGRIRAAAAGRAEPASVVACVACYSASDGVELYAVVDGPGGRTIEAAEGAPTFCTVSTHTPFVKDIMAASIGESLVAGDDIILIIGKAGSLLPSTESCDEAILRRAEVSAFCENWRAALAELNLRLDEQGRVLAKWSPRFHQFGELLDISFRCESFKEDVAQLAARLSSLTILPLARCVDSLFTAIAHESTQLDKLRQEIDACLRAQGAALADYGQQYQQLEDARRQTIEARRDERERINALYRETLVDPLPVDYRDAQDEFDYVMRLSDIEPDEGDTLRRYLRTIRLRCLKSISLGERYLEYEALIDKIDAILRIGASNGDRDADANEDYACVDGANAERDQLSLGL